MIHPPQTLHDFVATLLSDGAARSAFVADPTATLAEAGLQDITTQDVQEVVPLVLDYAPNDGLASLEDGLSDPEAAIAHLQAVAQSAAPAPEMGTVAGETWGSEDSFGAAGTLSNQLGYGAGGVDGNLDGGQGGLMADSALGSAIGTTQLSADRVAGEFELANSEAGFESQGHIQGTTSSGVHGGGGGESPLGSVSLHGGGGSDGFQFNGGGDPSNSLDSDTLGEVAQTAAGTVASYVSNGGDAFANEISSGGETLGAYLTGGADTASEQIGNGADTMAGHVSNGSDQLAGQIEQAPAHAQDPSGMNPGLDPEQAPDVRAELPGDGGLPQGGELPDSGLPSDVPAELPNLPVENPMPEAQPAPSGLEEGVSQSPVGTPVPEEAPSIDSGGSADDLGLGG